MNIIELNSIYIGVSKFVTILKEALEMFSEEIEFCSTAEFYIAKIATEMYVKKNPVRNVFLL